MTDSPLRSPHLLSRDQSALLIIDIQEKLLPAIPSRLRLTWNVVRLIKAAHQFAIPLVASEQYPQGLGPTVGEIAACWSPTHVQTKTQFSCGGCRELWKVLPESRRQLVLVGMETHVCVLQSALDLLASSYDVFIPVDAVGARGSLDHDVAIRRIENAGGVAVTTESVLFEWCHDSAHPAFKDISQLVRETPP